MSVDIEPVDIEADAGTWDRYVDRAEGTNPFYRAAALRLQAGETGTTPHALAGFKGQELVGLFPVFEYRRGPVAAAFSPAPFAWTCYLGPALANTGGLKRRTADRRNRRFLEGCLDWIDREISPVYSKFTAAEYPDVRPFVWNDFDVQPGHTYVVDLDGGPEELLGRFSGDARNNVRNADGGAYEIEEGNAEDIRRIVEQVRTRYRSQGGSFQLSTAFARSLYDALPAGELRPYACRIDGEFVGGILVVESGDTRYRWQGGVKPDADVDLPVNDLLDWRVMTDGIEAGIERYDLVGAGVPSINRYKAKFNPHLETTFEATAGVLGIDRLVESYRKVS